MLYVPLDAFDWAYGLPHHVLLVDHYTTDGLSDNRKEKGQTAPFFLFSTPEPGNIPIGFIRKALFLPVCFWPGHRLCHWWR